MSALFNRPIAAVFIEFTDSSVVIANDARAVELPLERDAAGTVTAASVESIRGALTTFATKPGDQAFCLLPARGVSIRRISLPAANDEAIKRLLPLQIDAHFPLSAEDLAWGYKALTASVPSREGAPLQELLVVAAKKTALQQYRDLLSAAGLSPVFGIAALAREGACPQRAQKFGVLEIGRQNSELLTFDESGPSTLRVVGIGSESGASAEPLLSAMRANGAVEKIFVSGKNAALWSARIAPNIPAEPLALPPGQSSAIAGLRETLRRGHEPLLIHADHETVRLQRAPSQWRWAAAAAILLLLYLGLRYVEPLLRKNQLTRTISELTAARAKMPKIDREAAFLQYIHTNQPNYLEAVGSLAAANQPGMKLDALSIQRRGDISLRGQAQNAQAVGTLRSKMIDSGAFANVVIDEQTPTQPGQQQVNFRMTAELIPERERKPIVAKPGADKTSAGSTNKPAAKSSSVKSQATPLPAAPATAAPPSASPPPPSQSQAQPQPQAQPEGTLE